MAHRSDSLLATALFAGGLAGLAYSGQTMPGKGTEQCNPAQPQPPVGLDCPSVGCSATATCSELSGTGTWADGGCVEGTKFCEPTTNNNVHKPTYKCTQVDCTMEGGGAGKDCAAVRQGDSSEKQNGVQSCNGK